MVWGNGAVRCIFELGRRRYGVWGDWDDPYTTLEPKYEAAQLRVFAKLVGAGHIYRRRPSSAHTSRPIMALHGNFQSWDKTAGFAGAFSPFYLIPQVARSGVLGVWWQ